MIHRWKYSLKRGNKGYLYSTSIAVGVIIFKMYKVGPLHVLKICGCSGSLQ